MNAVLAFAAGVAALAAAAPAPAAVQGYYRATPVQPAEKPMLVTRDTVWRCAEGTCAAPKSASRDAIICELIVQRTGALTAFSANGADFDAAALEKCNARAK